MILNEFDLELEACIFSENHPLVTGPDDHDKFEAIRDAYIFGFKQAYLKYLGKQ